MKKALAVVSSLLIGVAAEAALVRLVPEEGISKAFTLVVDFDKATEKMSAVDIPSECNWVAFEFKADDESDASLAAKGIWKNVEFSAE